MRILKSKITKPLPQGLDISLLQANMLRATLAEKIHVAAEMRDEGRSMNAQGSGPMASRVLFLSSLEPRDDAAMLLAAWADLDYLDDTTRDHLHGRMEWAIEAWLAAEDHPESVLEMLMA